MSVLLRERRESVELLTIHRPKALNAIDPSVLEALDAAVSDLENDPGVRCVVLTGSGEKAFVAGADIKAMADLSAVDAQRFAAMGQRVLDRLSALHCPVIAAVNGFALGGGCELAMACDLIFASESARFGQPEVALGVIPGFGGTQRLVRRVGPSVALDLCLTGRRIKADKTLRIGLVSRVTGGNVVETALEAAANIAAMGPVAVRLCKQTIHAHADGDLAAGLRAEAVAFGMCFATDDQTEGRAAFVEKRQADFTGR
jgi:enoyl-CoA hydratase